MIVGCGPAGSATAVAAARLGLRTAMFDGAVFPREKVCGEYLSASGWRLLAALGLDRLRAAAATLTTMRLAVDDCDMTLSYSADPLAAPAALSRFRLDAALAEAAREAGAEIEFGRRVRRVVVENGRAVGVELAVDGESAAGEIVSARLVVAADGRRSVVVRDTGVVRAVDTGLLGIKRHVRLADGPSLAGIELHSLPGGYLGICPTQDGDLNLCGVAPRRLFREAHGNIDAVVQQWLSERRSLRPYLSLAADAPWHAIPDVSLLQAHPKTAGVLYVGDARGTIEPLTGQGMTMALEAARFVGELLQRVGPEITTEVQREYDARWNATFDSAIRSSTRFGQLVRRPRLLKAVIRVGSFIPVVGDFILRSAYRRTLTLPA